MTTHGFQWYLNKTSGEINTLGVASDHQELLMRIEVELQNLQDALINQDLDRALFCLATGQNVGALMARKIELALALELRPDSAETYDLAPIIECPYCLREMQTVASDERGWVMPDHSLLMHTDNVGNPAPEDIDCPNSGKGPAEFLIKE
ncbi:MAG: hypothetical protein V3V08_13130 [Nannocystaceae bacterium]